MADVGEFVCPACKCWLWLTYTSDRTGNIRYCTCTNRGCDSKWLAVWKGKPMKSCIGEPKHTKASDWSFVRAGTVMAVCWEEELP